MTARAFGVLVVNDPKWTIKANVLAREVLRAYFASQHVPGVTAPRSADASSKDGAKDAKEPREPSSADRHKDAKDGKRARSGA